MTRKEHLLTTLVEEFNETAQRVSKALRFGLNEIQPGQLLSNAERIIYEFNDIVAVMEMLRDEGYFTILIDKQAIELKKEKVNKYIKFSEECGTVSVDNPAINFPHTCSVCGINYVDADDEHDICHDCSNLRI